MDEKIIIINKLYPIFAFQIHETESSFVSKVSFNVWEYPELHSYLYKNTQNCIEVSLDNRAFWAKIESMGFSLSGAPQVDYTFLLDHIPAEHRHLFDYGPKDYDDSNDINTEDPNFDIIEYFYRQGEEIHGSIVHTVKPTFKDIREFERSRMVGEIKLIKCPNHHVENYE